MQHLVILQPQPAAAGAPDKPPGVQCRCTVRLSLSCEHLASDQAVVALLAL